MKKGLIVLLASAIILIFSGCESNSSASDFPIVPEIIPSSGPTETEISDPYILRESKLAQKVLERLNNDTPYDELITKEVDIHDFLSKYTGATGYITERPNMGDIDHDYTIECIRKNDADYFYSVHKVKQGGLLYVFYGNTEKYIQYSYHYYYVVKPMSKAELKTIKKGSTIEDVEAIDPATTVFKQHIIDYIEENPLDETENTIRTEHYLTDGSYSIYYEMKDERFIVTDITYYPYNYDEIEDFQFEKEDWHILPQDYLPSGG